MTNKMIIAGIDAIAHFAMNQTIDAHGILLSTTATR
jgi:hypothetical protein